MMDSPAKLPPPNQKPLSPKIFQPPSVLEFLTAPRPPDPPSDWKWLHLHFSHMATSNKHMFIFVKLL